MKQIGVAINENNVDNRLRARKAKVPIIKSPILILSRTLFKVFKVNIDLTLFGTLFKVLKVNMDLTLTRTPFKLFKVNIDLTLNQMDGDLF